MGEWALAPPPFLFFLSDCFLIFSHGIQLSRSKNPMWGKSRSWVWLPVFSAVFFLDRCTHCRSLSSVAQCEICRKNSFFISTSYVEKTMCCTRRHADCFKGKPDSQFSKRVVTSMKFFPDVEVSNGSPKPFLAPGRRNKKEANQGVKNEKNV